MFNSLSVFLNSPVKNVIPNLDLIVFGGCEWVEMTASQGVEVSDGVRKEVQNTNDSVGKINSFSFSQKDQR